MFCIVCTMKYICYKKPLNMIWCPNFQYLCFIIRKNDAWPGFDFSHKVNNDQNVSQLHFYLVPIYGDTTRNHLIRELLRTSNDFDEIVTVYPIWANTANFSIYRYFITFPLHQHYFLMHEMMSFGSNNNMLIAKCASNLFWFWKSSFPPEKWWKNGVWHTFKLPGHFNNHPNAN